MEQSNHNRKVEKAMKDALKNDRARIQVGRISSFGLMEMSRQRLRTGVLEASTKACPHCEGTGLMRTASSSGLSALRIIEDEAARGRGDRILLRAGREAAVYVLNKKRAELAEIEERYGVIVEVMIDEAFEGARMSVESSGARPNPKDRAIAAPIIDEDDDEDYGDEIEEDEAEIEDEQPARREDAREGGREGGREAREGDDEGARRKRRRRRGGRGRNRRDGEPEQGGREDGGRDEGGREAAEIEGEVVELVAHQDDGYDEAGEQPVEAGDERVGADGEERTRSRRGRRGGRSRRGRSDATPGGERVEGELEPTDSPMIETPLADEQPIAAVEAVAEIGPVTEDKPKTRRRPRARKADAVAPVEAAIEPPVEASATPADDEAAEPVKPKRRSRAKKPVLPVETELATELAAADAAEASPPAAPSNDQSPAVEPAAAGAAGAEESADEAGTRRGWWQRTFG
jgi:ribonuclease E